VDVPRFSRWESVQPTSNSAWFAHEAQWNYEDDNDKYVTAMTGRLFIRLSYMRIRKG
jgi:hypothetical protein